MVKTSELRTKEVINVEDGRRLGTVGDLELELGEGRIQAIVLPGPSRFLGLFGRDRDIVVPWEHIEKIGHDVILIRLQGVAELNG